MNYKLFLKIKNDGHLWFAPAGMRRGLLNNPQLTETAYDGVKVKEFLAENFEKYSYSYGDAPIFGEYTYYEISFKNEEDYLLTKLRFS